MTEEKKSLLALIILLIILCIHPSCTNINAVNILNGRSFDHKSVRNTVPLDPHRLLVGLGLTTISISIFI
jgi:hypothetical protein